MFRASARRISRLTQSPSRSISRSPSAPVDSQPGPMMAINTCAHSSAFLISFGYSCPGSIDTQSRKTRSRPKRRANNAQQEAAT